MAEAKRDGNRVATLIGVSSSDGKTPTLVAVDPALLRLLVSAVVTEISPTGNNPISFEDTNFVTGDSPVTLDFNAGLGENSISGYIINDGTGSFTIALSEDGTVFGDEITLKKNDIYKWKPGTEDVDKVRVTWVADSAYRSSGS